LLFDIDNKPSTVIPYNARREIISARQTIYLLYISFAKLNRSPYKEEFKQGIRMSYGSSDLASMTSQQGKTTETWET
jgi:hypothetical protein